MFVNKLWTHISNSKRCFDVKSSTSYFHVKTKILADFQICISVPLSSQHRYNIENNALINNSIKHFLLLLFARNACWEISPINKQECQGSFLISLSFVHVRGLLLIKHIGIYQRQGCFFHNATPHNLFIFELFHGRSIIYPKQLFEANILQQ